MPKPVSKVARVDIFMPLTSRYHALHHFTVKIFEAFSRQNLSCRLVDVPDFFKTSVDDPPDLTFGINGVPFDENRRMLCDIIKVPHFSYLIDPPFRFYELLTSPNILVGCDDEYGCHFLNEVHFEKTYFMPHGVDRTLRAEEGQHRDIDVLMLASFIDYEALRRGWQAVMSKKLSLVMDDAIDMTFSDIKTSFIEAYTLSYKEHFGLKADPDRMSEEFALPLLMLERYVKGKERADLLKSIKDTDVVVYNGRNEGEPGWEKILGDQYPNITLREPVDYEEGLEAMKRSKVVLNSFIKNKEGTHDRVLNAFACGSLPLTNENVFMNRYFEDEKNILFFTHSHLDEVNDKIHSILADEDKRKDLAAKGREIVMSAHTWDHRVSTLLEELNPDL